MSEVEKMYRNAESLYCNKCRRHSEIDCIYMCENKYPPFTAEKQLSLIKWLIQQNMTDYRIINYFEDSYYCFYAWEEGFKESDLFKSYEEALACLFNHLWQDLTEEERKQIKEILNE